MANKNSENITNETATSTSVEDTAATVTEGIKSPRMVTIKIPKTRSEQDDVYVCVNGKSWLIKRGVNVEVPYYVAEVLEYKDKMLAQAMEFELQAAEKAQ